MHLNAPEDLVELLSFRWVLHTSGGSFSTGGAGSEQSLQVWSLGWLGGGGVGGGE